MAIEHFLNDPKIISIIDTLIVNEDPQTQKARLRISGIAALSNTTVSKVKKVISKLYEYDLLDIKTGEFNEQVYSLNTSPIAQKLRELEDLVNLYQCKKEESGNWKR